MTQLLRQVQNSHFTEAVSIGLLAVVILLLPFVANAQQTARLHGTVTGDQGAAIEGAYVYIYDKDSEGIAYAVSGNDGRYTAEFRVGNGPFRVLFNRQFLSDVNATRYEWEWHADAADFESATAVSVVSGGEVTIDGRLTERARIEGRVTDKDGNPLVGVDVGIGRNWMAETVLTDDDGRYVLWVDSKDSPFNVKFRPDPTSGFGHEYFDNAAYPSEGKRIVVAAGDRIVGIDAALESKGTVWGVVRDEAGEPIPDVWVSANIPRSVSDSSDIFAGDTTASDGSYELSISLLGGMPRVQFQTYEFEPEFHDDVNALEDGALERATLVDIDHGESIEINATLTAVEQNPSTEPLGTIWGTVSNESGEPIPNVRVETVHPGNNGTVVYMRDTRTGLDGSYEIEASTEQTSMVFLCFHARGYTDECHDNARTAYHKNLEDFTPVNFNNTGRLEINATLALGEQSPTTISGTVRNLAGQSLGNILVHASKPKPGAMEGDNWVIRVRTEEDGSYQVGAGPESWGEIDGMVNMRFDDTANLYQSARRDVAVTAGANITGFDVVLRMQRDDPDSGVGVGRGGAGSAGDAGSDGGSGGGGRGGAGSGGGTGSVGGAGPDGNLGSDGGAGPDGDPGSDGDAGSGPGDNSGPEDGPGGDSGTGGNTNICVGEGACSIGDPHLRSFDQVKFNFHALGEFHFARSDEQDIDVQVRYYAAGYTTISLTQGIAARVAGQRITVMLGRENLVEINGVPATINSGAGNSLVHDSGIAIERQDTNYRIKMPLGVSINLKTGRYHMDVEVVSAEHQVAGLGGSNDGIRDNDLTVRNGDSLSVEYGALSYDQLYRQFGDSWRITQDHSLFDYADGESTATFTDLSYPEKHLELGDLDPAARANAEKVCRAAGVPPGIAFDDCVYDVAITNDESFVQSYVGSASLATLDAPATADAGSTITVHWTGPANDKDFVSLASLDQRSDLSRDYQNLGETPNVVLRVPGIPGEYELRYVTDRGQIIATSVPLTVTAAQATLDGPGTAAAGSTINVNWTGPANHQDFVSIASPDQRADLSKVYSYLDDSGMVELVAPGVPGDYELRYVIKSGNQLISSQPLTVTDVSATLAIPATAKAGSTISVGWTGPAYRRDRIVFARAEDSGSKFAIYAMVSAESDSVSLKTPREPGDYVVRYVINSDQQIIAEAPITIE